MAIKLESMISVEDSDTDLQLRKKIQRKTDIKMAVMHRAMWRRAEKPNTKKNGNNNYKISGLRLIRSPVKGSMSTLILLFH